MLEFLIVMGFPISFHIVMIHTALRSANKVLLVLLGDR